ncbi:MAG: DEDD exonuclease domain-containing protein [Actinomycetota bacterium]
MTEHLFAPPRLTPEAAPAPPRQRTLEDLGTPLHEVTFVVFDIETTGGKAEDGGITEIGAVKLRGGECLGTYQTLINPGRAIPPEITVLTGITEAMVYQAPRIETVLPSFLDFVGDDSVLVGHNVRYDLSFINAALERDGRPRLANRSVDTLPLARRLLRDEVPNCRLGTLADRLRLSHTPSHRALDDALATGDLLHVLLERAGAMGVTGLDDLLALPTMAGNAQASKLRLTDRLPRKPGVYLFRGRSGDVLYVGKAANLRSRVRSYFSTDERRKIGQLLRETHRVDHQVCRNGLEAAVLELRLIHEHLPRFNHQGTRSSRYPYVKLTLNERFPRLSVVRTVNDDGGLYLGPISSAKRARRLIEAIETASPVRRCTARSTARTDKPMCAAAQIGVAACPCSGHTSPDDYEQVIATLVDGLTVAPDRLLTPLARRIADLADEERYEEAADVRDRADALAGALRRQRRFDLLRRAGRIRFRVGTAWAELDNGRLSGCGSVDDPPSLLDLRTPSAPDGAFTSGPLPPPSRADADELLCVARWLDENAHRVELEAVDGILAEPLPRLPAFSPKKRSAARAATAAARSRR